MGIPGDGVYDFFALPHRKGASMRVKPVICRKPAIWPASAPEARARSWQVGGIADEIDALEREIRPFSRHLKLIAG